MDQTSEVVEITPEELSVPQPVPENKKVWHEQTYWKDKGEPKEKITLKIGDRELNVVNFNKDINFGDYQERALKTIEDFNSRFPDALEKLKWILIRDFQPPPVHEGFPSNGLTLVTTPEGTMVLEPRAFENLPHRVEAAPNLEGTLVHELGHQIEESYYEEWKKFWPDMFEDRDNWILDKRKGISPAELNPPKHKITGQEALNGRYLSSPEECINDYAKIKPGEDICESLVAYLYDPERLKAVSAEKFEIIQKHDQTVNPKFIE